MAIRIIDGAGKAIYCADAGALVRSYSGPWTERAIESFAVRFGITREQLAQIAPAVGQVRATAPMQRAGKPTSHVERLMRAKRLQQEARLIQAGFSIKTARRLAGSKV